MNVCTRMYVTDDDGVWL